jgi:hypothetical protein
LGLVRRFRKGEALSAYSADEVSAVVEPLNGRPRKTLGWKPHKHAIQQTFFLTKSAAAQTNVCDVMADNAFIRRNSAETTLRWRTILGSRARQKMGGSSLADLQESLNVSIRAIG